MAMTPGYYMPTVYGNNMYPQMSYGQAPIQQSYAAAQPVQSPPQTTQGIIWVDGEVGAKAYQLTPGQAGPVALWDTNDTVIYLKSVNQMGMPNPLQKIHYTMEEQQNVSALPGNNASQQVADYATRDDFEAMRKEIHELREMLGKGQSGSYGMNQNSNNSGQQNRGGKG